MNLFAIMQSMRFWVSVSVLLGSWCCMQSIEQTRVVPVKKNKSEAVKHNHFADDGDFFGEIHLGPPPQWSVVASSVFSSLYRAYTQAKQKVERTWVWCVALVHGYSALPNKKQQGRGIPSIKRRKVDRHGCA